MILLLNKTKPFIPTAWSRIIKVTKPTIVWKYQTPQTVISIEVDNNIHIPNCELIGIRPQIDTDVYITYLNPESFSPLRIPQVLEVFYDGEYYRASIDNITYDPAIIHTVLKLNALSAKDTMAFLNSVREDLDKWLAEHT